MFYHILNGGHLVQQTAFMFVCNFALPKPGRQKLTLHIQRKLKIVQKWGRTDGRASDGRPSGAKVSDELLMKKKNNNKKTKKKKTKKKKNIKNIIASNKSNFTSR